MAYDERDGETAAHPEEPGECRGDQPAGVRAGQPDQPKELLAQ